MRVIQKVLNSSLFKYMNYNLKKSDRNKIMTKKKKNIKFESE